MDFQEFVEKSAQARSEAELFNILKLALKGIGFDRVLFSLMTDHVQLGLKAGHGIMQSYPEDWMAHYVANNFRAHDPVYSFTAGADRFCGMRFLN